VDTAKIMDFYLMEGTRQWVDICIFIYHRWRICIPSLKAPDSD
jgi:hypothetical protein